MNDPKPELRHWLYALAGLVVIVLISTFLGPVVQ
jgi:hypothetical protein